MLNLDSKRELGRISEQLTPTMGVVSKDEAQLECSDRDAADSNRILRIPDSFCWCCKELYKGVVVL